jgi:ABC-type transporter Mla subunit MlaD
MASDRTRNNVRAGIFVTVSIVLAVATIVVLTDAVSALFHPTNQYVVAFNVADGVKNLKRGGEVRVGGVLLGRVDDVQPRIEPDAPLQKIDVTFSLRRQVRLYADAQIGVSPALIGADAKLDVVSVGTAEAGAVRGTLAGLSAGPGVMAALLGPADAQKTSEIVENARQMMEHARDAAADVDRLTGRITDEDWPRWVSRIDKVMDWAVGATGRFDAVLDDGQAAVREVRGIVTDNRPRIDDIAVNVQDVTRRLREETVDKVNRVLDTGQQGLDAAVAILEKVDREFDAWAPEVRAALAAARLTAQQLKLASIEVRRSPWKLLYRPDASELEHELLYEATRTFALAVSDLRAAAESTERLVNNHGAAIAASPELRRQVSEFLTGSLERYESAQQKLLDVLIADEHGPK